MPLLLDVMVLVILAYSAFSGWKKGLIRTAAGFASTLLAIFVAWNLASALSQPLGGWMEQYMEQNLGEVITKISAEQDIPLDIPELPAGELLAAADKVLHSLGFSRFSQNPLTDAVMRKVKDEGMSLAQSTANTVCRAVAFSGVMVFGFLLIKAGLAMAISAASKVAELPALHMLDALGGTAFGLLSGVAALFLLGWALRFMGLWIPGEAVAGTRFMRLFADAGLLDSLSTSLAAKI